MTWLNLDVCMLTHSFVWTYLSRSCAIGRFKAYIPRGLAVCQEVCLKDHRNAASIKSSIPWIIVFFRKIESGFIWERGGVEEKTPISQSPKTDRGYRNSTEWTLCPRQPVVLRVQTRCQEKRNPHWPQVQGPMGARLVALSPAREVRIRYQLTTYHKEGGVYNPAHLLR